MVFWSALRNEQLSKCTRRRSRIATDSRARENIANAVSTEFIDHRPKVSSYLHLVESLSAPYTDAHASAELVTFSCLVIVGLVTMVRRNFLVRLARRALISPGSLVSAIVRV